MGARPTTANRLRALWAQGQTAFGTWCWIPSSFVAEILGEQGFDYVCIDCQHGLIDYESMWPMIQALRHSGSTPIVRVPSNDAAWIGKALDAGAHGVIVPLVNSASEAAAAAAACRYPPEGVRSFGPVRSQLTIAGEPKDVNREVLCIAMIETVQALEAADEICATPGLDAVYIGPADLAISMGPSLAAARESARHSEAVDAIRQACERHDIVAGMHTASARQARRYAGEGFGMCTLPSDYALLTSAARSELNEARDGTPD